MQLTYYEFAKEELETLDTGAATTGSSFTSSSSDSGQPADQEALANSVVADQEYEHAQRGDDPDFDLVRFLGQLGIPVTFLHTPCWDLQRGGAAVDEATPRRATALCCLLDLSV